jgi:hypothetical protein
MDLARMIVLSARSLENVDFVKNSRRIFIYVFGKTHDRIENVWDFGYIWITTRHKSIYYATTHGEYFSNNMLLPFPQITPFPCIVNEAIRRFTGSRNHINVDSFTVVMGIEINRQRNPMFPSLPCSITNLYNYMSDNFIGVRTVDGTSFGDIFHFLEVVYSDAAHLINSEIVRMNVN